MNRRYHRPAPWRGGHEICTVIIDERTMTVPVPGGVVGVEALDQYMAQAGGWERVREDPANWKEWQQ